jgi:hypothetical protein
MEGVYRVVQVSAEFPIGQVQSAYKGRKIIPYFPIPFDIQNTVIQIQNLQLRHHSAVKNTLPGLYLIDYYTVLRTENGGRIHVIIAADIIETSQHI